MLTGKTTAAILSLALALVATTTASRASAQTCSADSDCPAAMFCDSQSVSTCTGGAATTPCASNTLCEPVKTDPPACTTSIVRQCRYRSCSANADCGDRFFCLPSTMCSGSAGGGSGTATPGTSGGGSAEGTGASSGSAGTPVPPPATLDAGAVTCTTSYPGKCQPKPVPCTTDADCEAPWTCVAANVAVGVSTAPVDAGAAFGTPTTAPLPPDRTTTATSTETAIGTVTKTCQPPTRAAEDSSDSSTAKGPGTVSLGVDAGTGPGGLAPAPAADGGAKNGTTPTDPPVLRPDDNGGTSTVTATATGSKTAGASTGGGGCSVGAGGLSSGTLILLGLAAAIALLRQKRQD